MRTNFYISFGVWLFILPFFGIPGDWKNALFALSGVFLILVSLGPTILKKLQPKQKSRKKQNKIDVQNSHIENNELRFSDHQLNPPYLKEEEGMSEISTEEK